MHAKLNELITNLNAHVRIWMLEKTLPGTVANLNALDAYLNLNDVNAKFLDRSANLNARNTNLNYGFHGPDLFREFEWLLHQIEWQICEIDRENLYYYYNYKRHIKVQWNIIWPLEELYGRIFGGIPKNLVLCNFLRKLMVSDKKRFTGLLELIQRYKQNPFQKFFIFTIYQNYTLALNRVNKTDGQPKNIIPPAPFKAEA